MEQHIVKILSIHNITHNVRAYRIEKPSGYRFEPGQATDVSINKEGWQEEKRPFTFTSLNEYPYLEFTIKSYHDHPGVTHQLYQLKAGDELIIHDVWGAIAYRGQGCFIAGGAGITPFVAIFRQLFREKAVGANKLLFSNRTTGDIIYHAEFDLILGKNAVYVLTSEDNPAYRKGPIDKAFLQREMKDFSQPFYVCGPDPMVAALTKTLTELGAAPEAVVFEK
jgi:ferredoxin-NADP reductase